ncbi:unnamed protein product [Allacma fusca]|uniref:Uncharacterized protein n=1 Tax=Allacma fusca TaxID=39272 RepID=A0A8J2NI76_9HEXA|nr:unnamed protein product [Allacma fusca]
MKILEPATCARTLCVGIQVEKSKFWKMVDEAKWLEITRQSNPRNVHCPQGKIKVPEQRGGQINERIGGDGDRNNPSNNTVEIAVKELESRLAKMKELLEKKTRTIERQGEIIAKLNGRLANLTSESSRKSYLNDLALSSCETRPDEEKQSLDMQESVGDVMTKRLGGSSGRRLTTVKGSPKDQVRKTCNRSHNHNIDEQRENTGETPARTSPVNKVQGSQSFLERLDSLETKMDNLEAELPKRIRAICAELFQRGLVERRYKSDDSGTTSTRNPSPSTGSTTAVPEVSHAEMGVDASPNMEFLSSQHRKFDPLASIPGLLSEKCVHHSNPPDPFKWNKSPVIKPKTNLSANYRLHHASKSGEKWLKSHHNNLQPFPSQMVEEKLSSIEQRGSTSVSLKGDELKLSNYQIRHSSDLRVRKSDQLDQEEY